MRWCRSLSLFAWDDDDVEAEGCELGDQAAGVAFLAQPVREVVGAEVLAGDEVAQDVPGGDQDGVADPADSGPKVLVCDFNAAAKAPELAPLWQQMRDANPNGGATYPAINPVNRSDFVTGSPDITVVGAQEVATNASDHRPVVTDRKLHQRGR